MAIFHLDMQIICRSAGRSVIAAAAYRNGKKLRDERLGVTHNYTRRKHVCYSVVHKPAGSPAWMSDSEMLWGHVEKQEARRDSQLAREMNLALPHELSRQEQIQLMDRFVAREFVSRGLVVEASIHDNPNNVHCHLLCTMRRVQGNSFGPKYREMNGDGYLANLRERWARSVNVFLMARGHPERVDHRSKMEIEEANCKSQRQPPHQEQQHKEKMMMKQPTSEARPHTKRRANTKESEEPVTHANSVACAGEPLRPELFATLLTYLTECLEKQFPDSHCKVNYDAKSGSYNLTVDGRTRVVITRERVVCETGSQEEVRLCIQACIDFGWSQIQLNGDDDFKRRAYDEAIRRGFRPADVHGYEPAAAAVPSGETSSQTSFAKISPYSWADRRRKFTK